MASKKPGKAGFPLKTGQMFLIGAIVMALITAVMFASMMGSGKSDKAVSKKEVKIVKLLVAQDFIPAGSRLEPMFLKRVEFPKSFLISDSYFKKEHELIGKTVRFDLMPGEIIYKQKLAGEGDRGGLPSMIEEGYRAVSVEISEVRGVAGLVKPGDYIDVMATFSVKVDRGKGYITRTILQDVKVLALAQTIVNPTKPGGLHQPKVLRRNTAKLGGGDLDDDSEELAKADLKEKKKSDKQLRKEQKEREKEREKIEKKLRSVSSVTLSLSPVQAEQIALIDEATDVHLALRAEGDHSLAVVEGANSEQVIYGRKTNIGWPPLPEARRQPTPSVAQHNKGVDKFDGLDDLDSPPTSMGPSVELIQGTSRTAVEF